VIRAIDEFMLGIKPWAPDNDIRIEPVLPKSVGYIKRHIRFAGKYVELTVRKEQENTKITLVK